MRENHLDPARVGTASATASLGAAPRSGHSAPSQGKGLDWLACLPKPESLREFGQPRIARSVFQLATTTIPFVLIWLAIFAGIQRGSWVALVLILPAGGFLSRLFVIMHDCAHRSYFSSRLANDLTGRVLGLLCFTPFTYWRITHAGHHATVGDLSRRGIGDVQTLTVGEYLALTKSQQFWYRIQRHPLILFGIAPAYVFGLRYRFAFTARSRSTLLSTQLTNLTLVTITLAFYVAGDLGTLLLTHLPLVWIMATVAVWLFYVEHQFESTYWANPADWRLREASLLGSSHVDLPRLLRYFTANIGPHHVHHLNPRIPNYRLYECLDRLPELQAVNRLALRSALKATTLGLWDEEARRLVAMPSVRSQRATPADVPTANGSGLYGGDTPRYTRTAKALASRANGGALRVTRAAYEQKSELP